MILNMIGGGGGIGYGLQIVEGLVRPKNPTQGMVWAKTEHKVTYYDLSATKPENPVEGTLWVRIGDSSSNKIVSPVSKEWITVYPLSAEQYISGEWEVIETMSYQNGEWVDWWSGQLYTPGNEWTNVTGGWYISRNMSGTLTKNADSMVLDSASSASSSAIAMNLGLNVEYGKFTAVNIKIGKFVTKNTSSNITITFRTGANHDSSTSISEKVHTGAISADTVLSLPIPSASVKTLVVYVYYGTATIKEIWLE